MIELGRHGGFILASYAVTVLIMGGFAWHCVRRYSAVKRQFADKAGTEMAGADNV
jgi:heme exporter protein CcmD